MYELLKIMAEKGVLETAYNEAKKEEENKVKK